MVSANGLIYAVGGEGPFSEHDDIEVHLSLDTNAYCTIQIVLDGYKMFRTDTNLLPQFIIPTYLNQGSVSKVVLLCKVYTSVSDITDKYV